MKTEIAKVCTRCDQSKSLSNFNSNKSKQDGKQSQCNMCQSQTVREWRERDKLKQGVITQ